MLALLAIFALLAGAFAAWGLMYLLIPVFLAPFYFVFVGLYKILFRR